MSTFNFNREFKYQKDYGISNAPSFLTGSVGASYLPEFIQTQVDRSIYGATEGGAGRWLFGTMRTPQRFVLDNVMGWDPDVASNVDPNFTPDNARNLWNSVPDAAKAAVLYKGGKELVDDIVENSVSQAHFIQRISEVEVITTASMSLDKYDREANMLTRGMHKTFSATINYVASDPMTTISIAATAGLAAAGVGAAAAGAATNQAGVIASIASNYNRTWRAATYLWDGIDGASSAYSEFKQLNDDGYRVYGKTFEADESWTDNVAMGAAFGLGFSMGSDALGLLFKGSRAPSTGISSIENMAARSSEGTLGTAIDHVAASRFRTSKSRLERSLDTIVGPDSELRRNLMDDDTRDKLFWGGTQDMDELSDWIEKNRPNESELNQHINDRLAASEKNRQLVEDWQGEVEEYILGGGDETAFFRKKAVDMLRTHMGEDFPKYRFVVDYLEEASGDIRLVAEWMARGDADRVVRVVNAINANKRVGVLEDVAINRALDRISRQGRSVAMDETRQALNRIEDNITQGRFRGAVDILNEMHQEVTDRHGRLLGEVDAAINFLNDSFTRLNDEAFENLDHFKEMIISLERFKTALSSSVGDSSKARRSLNSALDPDADNATVLMRINKAMDESNEVANTDVSAAFDDLQRAVNSFKNTEETLSSTLDSVRQEKRSLAAKTGVDGLDRTMTESGSFPLWKVELSTAGYNAVRRRAASQTLAGNRWKVEFVDRFLGEGAADNALASGTNPMRPVIKERPVMQPFTVAEQERILGEELQRIAPDIAKIKTGAADLPLDQKIVSNKDTIDRLKSGLDTAKAMRERGGADAGKLDKLIGKRERLIKRMENMNKRLQAQLDGQLESLNRDITPSSAITPESIRASRVSENIAAHTKEAAKLAQEEAKDVNFLYTKKGRNLRTKVRKAAANVAGTTEYAAAKKEAELIEAELGLARNRVDTLKKSGSTSADPELKKAQDELAYLEGQAKKVKDSINAIEGRPAMIVRTHNLNSSAPNVNDVVELSRLRSQIAVAVESGETEFAEELNRRLYAKYGDANRLPRWSALEDFFIKNQRAALEGRPKETLMTVTMDGRNVKYSVAEAAAQDVAVREGVDTAAAALPTKPTMPSKKSSAAVTEADIKARRAMSDQQQLEAALETDADVAAARAAAAAPQGVRYENAAVSDAADGLSVSKPTKETTKVGGKVEADAPDKASTILEKLVPKESSGERLVITNGVLMSMGRIPALRGLGRALFRAQAAGTGFGYIHNSSRVLDMMVAAFNMLDRPEALVKSLGFNNGSLRTLQNFRDRGRIAVNELAVAEQRAIRNGHLNTMSDTNIQNALDTGVTTGLTPGELEMHNILRRHYNEVGARLEISHPGVSRENYRPREANSNVILARQQEAQTDFANAYAERIRTSGNAIPNELADEFGIARGTSWSALSPEDQAAYAARLTTYSNEMAVETISRLTNGITENGVGYRRASNTPRSNSARSLEDEVANNPAVRRWYIGSPVQEHKIYMEVRAPQILFDAQLSEAVGSPSTFDDVIAAMRQHSLTMTDSSVRAEFNRGVDRLERKWNYHVGRAQYNHNEFLDPALRVSTGIVRGSAGAFWGMAGLTTEVPRAIWGAKMYGGSFMHGFMDALHAIRTSNDLGAIEDIAHATDQYSTYAHSAFGSSIGTSVTERFIAPWERFWHVATGAEVLTNGGTPMGRLSGSTVAAAEAFGETGMRAGGMQYFSGVARVIADRQAKRFVSRNLDAMERMATALERIGNVAENTDSARRAFKQAAADSGLPHDVALQMNHSGLLVPDVIRNLRNGLAGQEQVFNLGALRGRVDDRTMGAMMDYLTAAHNFHVPTSSLASSVESRSAIDKMFYNLTSYSRSFATNVAFRTAANGRMATMLATFAAVMLGENIYQSVRGIATGKSDLDKMEQDWNDDPVKFVMGNAIKSPWLGAHHSSALSVVNSFSSDYGMSMRGNNIFGPMIQSFNQFNRVLFSDEKTGERDYSFFSSHTPLFNTWYSRLMLGTDMEQ